MEERQIENRAKETEAIGSGAGKRAFWTQKEKEKNNKQKGQGSSLLSTVLLPLLGFAAFPDNKETRRLRFGFGEGFVPKNKRTPCLRFCFGKGSCSEIKGRGHGAATLFFGRGLLQKL